MTLAAAIASAIKQMSAAYHLLHFEQSSTVICSFRFVEPDADAWVVHAVHAMYIK
jgi:hypothetical protein